MGKTIGIVGSRRRSSAADEKLLREAFDKIYQQGDTIVSGGCFTGGDRFAEVLSEIRGIPIVIHPADWKTFPKAAGFIRNTKIAVDCDILLALVAKDRKGGAEDTIKKAIKYGRPVILI